MDPKGSDGDLILGFLGEFWKGIMSDYAFLSVRFGHDISSK
jgi:hypothetical protein